MADTAVGRLKAIFFMDDRQFRAGVKGVRAEVGTLANEMRRTAGAIAGLFVGLLGGSSFVALSDRYSEMVNILTVVTGSQEAANAKIQELAGIASRTRAPLESVVSLYQRLSISAREIGAGDADVLRFVENIGLALAQQGGSAEQAAGALLQMGQALGGGTVRAEEFNSILEGAYPILLAAAKGIDGAGGSVAKLRQIMLDGELSSTDFFRAILSQTEELETAFGKTTPTIGSAVAQVGNALTLFVGQGSGFLGVSEAIARSILAVASNIQRIASYAIAAAGAFGVQYVAGMVAAAAATFRLSGAMTVLRAAMLRTGILALVVGAGELIYQFGRLVEAAGGVSAALGLLRDVAREVWGRIQTSAAAMVSKIGSNWQSIKASAFEALAGALDATVSAGNRIVGVFRGAVAAIQALWSQLPASIGEMVYAAANAVIRGVEVMLNAVVARINDFVGLLNSALGALPSWATGGAPLQISLLGDINLGEIANPWKGAAADAGAAAGAAFSEAYGQNVFDGDASATLRDLAGNARDAAAAGSLAGDALAGLAASPLQSIKALRDVIFGAKNETTNLADAATNAGGALDNAGGGGKGRAKKGLEEDKKAADALKSAIENVKDTGRNAFRDLVTGAGSLKDTLADLLSRLSDFFLNAGFDSLWKAVGGDGIAGGLLKVFGVGTNAKGTDNWQGGLTWIGERGRELVDLPRGSRVIPNDVSERLSRNAGGSRGAAVEIVPSPYFDAVVQRQAAGVAGPMVTSAQEASRRELPARMREVQARKSST